jgi:undecaprenyl-diphosphatase
MATKRVQRKADSSKKTEEVPVFSKTNTDVRTRTYLIIFVAALAVLGGSSWFAVAHDRVTGLEHELLLAVNTGLPVRLSGSMKAVTLLGSLWVAVAAVAGSYFARLYRLAWRLALATLTSYGLATLIAHVVQRPRPIGPLDDIYVRAAASGFGFPSVQVALVTAMALTLVVYMPRKWWWTALLPIILVGVSRAYLGVEGPLDVLGGLMLGASVVTFFRVLPSSIRQALRIN